MDTMTRSNIEKITESCDICRMNTTKPRGFKLTIGADGLCFNARVQVDTIFISGKPVIHMVDEATHFCAAAFLRNKTEKEVWCAIQNLWTLVYMGPPDYLVVDQGSNYVSKELKGNADAHGVKIERADNGTITINQKDKIAKLKIPTEQKELNSQRARVQYIGVCTRPDISANVQLVAPGAHETNPEEYKILKKTIIHLQKTDDMNLT